MTKIVLAPFSNNALRDWPAAHYSETIGLMLDRLAPDAHISVVGTRGQRLGAAEIVRPFPADRVVNDCGISWESVLEKIRGASCVIGNNSGITHASRHFGTPTVCVFGGSHQRTEWGPLGDHVVILSRVIGCSPCQFNHAFECPYGAACLREIVPVDVVAAAFNVVARAGRHLLGERAKLAILREVDERKVATC
jgi:ADP-heptose:LPS heptosyltransferase